MTSPIPLTKSIALYAITKHGIAIAQRLMQSSLPFDLFVPEKYQKWCPQNTPITSTLAFPIAPFLAKEFSNYHCHVFLVSVGAVVRLIAPLLKNKTIDPAVVCVDDAARFAICLLSGHIGYGNAYTKEIAKTLDAQAVITTASDARDTLAVDILGRKEGWHIQDPDHHMTQACASVVNEMPVALIQETGEEDFWHPERPFPKGITFMRSLKELGNKPYQTLLLITDRIVARPVLNHHHTIFYRPLSLVLGIGCDRGVSLGLVERGILKTLKEHALSVKSVRTLATIDLKKDEPALLSLVKKWGWKMETFSPKVLDQTPGIATPSSLVYQYTGTRGVAEPACLRSSGANRLQITKETYKEEGEKQAMTIALARIPFPQIKRPKV